MPFVHEDTQYVRKRGSRREVLDGICYCTSGGLVAEMLEERNGKIISKKRSAVGKQRYTTKNPFKQEADAVEDEKVDKVDRAPKKRKRVTISETPVLVRVPVARRRRTRVRRSKK